jgi:hypothetical protein
VELTNALSAGFFVSKEVVDTGESGPYDAGDAHAAGFMGRYKETLRRSRFIFRGEGFRIGV